MATPHRVNRVREALLRELSDIVRRLRDPRARFATVVDAEVSRDLRHARMLISVLGSEDEKTAATEALQNAVGFIRRELAQRMHLRYVPEISVEYDDTSERAARITSLLDSIDIATEPADRGAPVPSPPEAGDANVSSDPSQGSCHDGAPRQAGRGSTL